MKKKTAKQIDVFFCLRRKRFNDDIREKRIIQNCFEIGSEE